MTYFIFSLGCKVNSYECSSLASSLRKRGYFENRENPDVVIVNTCSVTATADQKSRQHIRKFQAMYPKAIMVVMGCYAQGNSKFIAEDIKADIIVGTSHRNEIPDLIEEFIEEKKQIIKVDSNIRAVKCYEELGVTSYTENIRAYLKIQDGCNNFCSYCLIPYRRGSSRSRNKEGIILEAEHLIKQGYKEIVLTGIDVSSYGKDLGDYGLTDLVKDLLKLDIPSLRISSIEAADMSDELLSLYQSNPKLAKHMHIPLQSGSATVMERMHRKYTKEQFLSKIKRLRKYCPDIMISTDVITGFVGETEEEFLETRNFIIECGFNQLHVFPFSPRSGTLAFNMPNQVPADIKKERTRNLLELSKELWNKYVDAYVGKEINVLVEKYDDKKKVNIGHTSNYIEVAVPSNEGMVGSVITVKLEKSMITSK